MTTLPTLTAWASSHLTSLLEAATEDDFNTAFDNTFDATSTFVLNGQSLLREAYRFQLLQQTPAGLQFAAAATIKNATEFETGHDGELSGLVGIFYTVLSDSKIIVLGLPVDSRVTSSINLAIEPTEKNLETEADPRRVISLNQVLADTTFHLTLPKSALPTAGSSKTELGPGPVQLPRNYNAKYRGVLSGLLKPGTGAFGGLSGPGPEIPPE